MTFVAPNLACGDSTCDQKRWTSSAGVRNVVSETIGYPYTRFFFQAMKCTPRVTAMDKVVAQVSKPAVSQCFQPANVPSFQPHQGLQRSHAPTL